MKKLLFTLASLFLMANAQATNLTEGKQYTTLNVERSIQPEVIEFFSFYCPHCYSFEANYHIPEKVKNALPEGTKFKQYHVTFLGFQSENLTRAWALAMALGVEDKVRAPLFEISQKAVKDRDQTAPNLDAIRQIFLNNGVNAEQFDGGINSFAVTGLYNQQVQAAQRFNVRGVPDFYVNGKYRVNPEGLSHSEEGFIQDYVETIKGLLQK